MKERRIKMKEKQKQPDTSSKEFLVGALDDVCKLVKQTSKDVKYFGPNDNRDILERIAAIGGNALYQAGYRKIGRRLLGSFEPFAPFAPWDGGELRRKRRPSKRDT